MTSSKSFSLYLVSVFWVAHAHNNASSPPVHTYNNTSSPPTGFLQVDKASKTFLFNQKRVFLTGANQPWIDYGNDFGNNQTNGKVCALQSYIANLSKAGGNSMRMWLFIEGDNIPAFNSDGMVTAPDSAGSLIAELQTYAQFAAANNVFINLCLWNGAMLRNANAINLFKDQAKLDSFITNALTPIVKALADEPGIGSWEIINEPEGSLSLTDDAQHPCFDTKTVLQNTGAGWAGHHFTMKELLYFISKQAAAIHHAAAHALVTVGSWSQYPLSDALRPYQDKGFRNYYKDECLMAAGGEDAAGVLDYYQVHSYPDQAPGTPEGGFPPFAANATIYQLDKPLIIGEFAHSKCKGNGCTVASLYNWAYTREYQGCWGWSMNSWKGTDGGDGEADILPGLHSLKDKSDVQVDIRGKPPPDTCHCSDVAPPGGYTCVQQAGWGKCGESWMKGLCCRSCHACQGCQ